MSDASAAPAGRPLDAAPGRRPGRVRLLALDVDGTVCDSRHTVADDTVSAIHRLRSAGIAVLLATGRRYRDTLPIAARLGVDGPLVTASGALVKDPRTHATLERAAFAPEVLGGVLRDIVARGHEPIVYSDSYAEGFDFHCRSLPSPDAMGRPVDEYLQRNRGLADVRPDLHLAPPAGAFAGFVMGSRAAMHGLEAALRATWSDRLSLHTILSPRYQHWMCEIAPAGVTKWSGVLAVAERLGVAPEEICAVGDDVNDLPMIRAAGLGIAMGNAGADVRRAARHVVASHDEGGIAEVADLLLAGLAQPAPSLDPKAG